MSDAARRRVGLAAGCCAIGILLAGCGAPSVSVPKTDPRYDFERGRVEFQRHHWLETQTYLKRFLETSPGNAAADSAQLLIARALFESKSYAEAAVEFGVVPREYPRSPLREEEAYFECVSTFRQMRSSQLDPTFANRAAACFQEFLLRYPGTTWKDAAQEQLREIDDRLAEKQYRLGVMFAKMKRPAAARVYLEDLLQKHPQSRWVPSTLYWVGRSQELQGELGPAQESYERLLRDYPESEAARDAKKRVAVAPPPAESSAPADTARARPQP